MNSLHSRRQCTKGFRHHGEKSSHACAPGTMPRAPVRSRSITTPAAIRCSAGRGARSNVSPLSVAPCTQLTLTSLDIANHSSYAIEVPPVCSLPYTGRTFRHLGLFTAGLNINAPTIPDDGICCTHLNRLRRRRPDAKIRHRRGRAYSVPVRLCC
jgi:hypothetical protein